MKWIKFTERHPELKKEMYFKDGDYKYVASAQLIDGSIGILLEDGACEFRYVGDQVKNCFWLDESED